MTDIESGSLLERFRAREEGALAELYDRTSGRAYGLACRVLRDGAAAEDVVQEAFASLWEQADRLDAGRGGIEGLLLTVVHRRAVDHARARQRQRERSAPPEVEPAEADPTPLEPVVADGEAAEHARQVRAALQVLPEAQRQVVTLAYFGGRSQQEIAERIDVPLGTVKSRLRLAMQRLRYELGAPEAAAPGDGAADGA